MRPAALPLALPRTPSEAQRGPHDDFYCAKFEVWYPSQACVFRHVNRTFPACADCFQGRVNSRHAERGLPVPEGLPPEGPA